MVHDVSPPAMGDGSSMGGPARVLGVYGCLRWPCHWRPGHGPLPSHQHQQPVDGVADHQKAQDSGQRTAKGERPVASAGCRRVRPFHQGAERVRARRARPLRTLGPNRGERDSAGPRLHNSHTPRACPCPCGASARSGGLVPVRGLRSRRLPPGLLSAATAIAAIATVRGAVPTGPGAPPSTPPAGAISTAGAAGSATPRAKPGIEGGTRM